MKINGTDVSVWGARQWNVEMGHCYMENETDQKVISISPALLPSRFGCKKFSVTLLIKADSREELWHKGGEIICELRGTNTVTLDGWSTAFACVLVDYEQKEFVQNRSHRLILEFVGYEYGTTRNASVGVGAGEKATLTVTNEGSAQTPVDYMYITEHPAESTTDSILKISVSGLCRDSYGNDAGEVAVSGTLYPTGWVNIKVDGKTGKTEAFYTIDGNQVELKTVTTFPGFFMLLPGENILTCQNDGDLDARVGIYYTPHYL